MKAVVLLSFLNAIPIFGQKLFIPSRAQVRETSLQIPGFLINQEDALTVLGDESVDTFDVQKPFHDVESRRFLGTGAASSVSRAGVFSSLTFQADSGITATAPFCLACTCQLGRISCRDAGGVAFMSNGEVIEGVPAAPAANQPAPQQRVCGTAAAGQTAACIMEAPLTMSACDPKCRKRTATCGTNVAQAALNCNENVNRLFCGTACEFRAPGEKVVCNQQDIANGVMNDLPRDVCNILSGRKRRSTRAENRANGFLGNSFLTRLIPFPFSTVRVPGTALLAYAPTGRCMPPEIARAPLCTRLD